MRWWRRIAEWIMSDQYADLFWVVWAFAAVACAIAWIVWIVRIVRYYL